MKKIKYRISDRFVFDGRGPVVEGFAVMLPHPWRDFHCCIRQLTSGYWKVDNFETGGNIASEFGENLEEAIVNLIEYLDGKGVKAVAARMREVGIPWKPSKPTQLIGGFMNQHTPEPWSNPGQFDIKGDGFHIYFGQREIVASANVMLGTSTARANARRIVACVNSCAEFSTEDLENSTTDKRHRALIIADLTIANKRCDELLQLLSVAMCPNCDGSGAKTFQNSHGDAEQEQCRWCDEKHAAIAKAEQS